MLLSNGSLVALVNRSSAAYQVVNVDEDSGCVWVRRWPPLQRRSSPFSVPIGEISHVPPQLHR